MSDAALVRSFSASFRRVSGLLLLLTAFERIELTPTNLPCREIFYVLYMPHNGPFCGTF